MKVRAITVGFRGSDEWVEFESRLRDAADIGNKIASALRKDSWEVQGVRVTTDAFGGDRTWFRKLDLRKVACVVEDLELTALSFGWALTDADLEEVPRIMEASDKFFCAAVPSSPPHTMMPSSTSMQKIAQLVSTLDAAHCFRFSACIACEPGIPFFPAACHPFDLSDTRFSVSLATENGDVLMAGVNSSNGELSTLTSDLHMRMQRHLGQIQQTVERALSGSDELGLPQTQYLGVDPSWNPSLRREESLALAAEIFLRRKFGSSGTLSFVAAATRALGNISTVKKVGFQGMMLPVMEDLHLSEKVAEGSIGVSGILQLCSVCGVGLDTIPISTSATTEDIFYTIADVASLATKWQKPLSVRLIRVPGNPGNRVDLHDERLCPSVIMSLGS